jgi:DNA-binding transcriptional ArsR family regulator
MLLSSLVNVVEELVRPKQIADAIGESSLNVGKDLHDLKERGLAVAEEEGLWKITPDGTEWIIETDKRKKASTPTETRTERKPEQIEKTVTIPTQSDILKSIENGDGYNHRSQSQVTVTASGIES